MRLLIVEDDPDGREMLAELFQLHGWQVTAVPTTGAGISELRKGVCDVVISDENLEGESGSSMLCQASAEGLLEHVGALMYTAEPRRLNVPDGVRVLRKPLGLFRLIDEAKAVAHNDPASGPPSSAKRRTKKRPAQLVLYVTNAPSSQRALRTLEKVLDDGPASTRDESPPSRSAR